MMAVSCGGPSTSALESCEQVAGQSGRLLVDAIERDFEILLEERGWDRETPLEASDGEDLPSESDLGGIPERQEQPPGRPFPKMQMFGN